MDKEQINSLIWGDFESKILDMKISLAYSREIMKSIAADGAFALFNGFLTYLMFKLGYKPKLPEDFEADLEDNTWWVENLDDSMFMELSYVDSMPFEPEYGIPPLIFKQFFNEIGKDVTICLLLDWFSFYELGLALNNSKLDEDSKYTQMLFDEFKIHDSPAILAYMKNLRDKDFAQSHKLILRPGRLADLVITLDDMHMNLEDFPDAVYRKEEWDKMRCGTNDLTVCNEDNFRELLEKASIEIPNVEFLTFSEFIQDKLTPVINDWSDIRDKYILKLENIISESHPLTNYNKARKFLQKAQNSLDKNIFSESIICSCNAIEIALFAYLKPEICNLAKGIKMIESDQKLKNHAPDLNYIRNVRNKIAHPYDFEATEDAARHVFDMTDQFLAAVRKFV